MGLETLSYAAFSHPPIFYCEKCGLVDIMGNFGTFNITVEDPENYSRVRYSQNAKGEVVADFYGMGDVKPASTSTFNWTNALLGGY